MEILEDIDRAITLNSNNVFIIGELCQLEKQIRYGLPIDITFLRNCIKLPGIFYLMNEYFYNY